MVNKLLDTVVELLTTIQNCDPELYEEINESLDQDVSKLITSNHEQNPWKKFELFDHHDIRLARQLLMFTEVEFYVDDYLENHKDKEVNDEKIFELCEKAYEIYMDTDATLEESAREVVRLHLEEKIPLDSVRYGHFA